MSCIFKWIYHVYPWIYMVYPFEYICMVYPSIYHTYTIHIPYICSRSTYVWYIPYIYHTYTKNRGSRCIAHILHIMYIDVIYGQDAGSCQAQTRLGGDGDHSFRHSSCLGSGAALLSISSVVHLDCWHLRYRSFATIS